MITIIFLRVINFSNILNVVLISKTVFTIICTANENLTFHTQNVEESEQWILALLEEEPENDSNIGLDSFEFIKEIGRGSHGCIYLAKHIETGQYYAIKQIPKENNSSQVLAEKNTLMMMNNPFIVKMFSAFQTDTHFYLVLEFVSGGDLSNYIEKLTKNQIKQIIAEIAVALESLHKEGIVFRDLKPQNILVMPNGHIKLADFGLARDIIHDKTTKTLCGTLTHVAPEMITKENYSFAVDWWSLGVIAYQMFFGKLPFNGGNQKELFDSIVMDNIKIPDSCNDPFLVSFVGGLLEKDPINRIHDIFSHHFMSEFSRESVKELKNDAGFRPMKFINGNEYDSFNSGFEEKIENIDQRTYIIPNFSFTFDKSPTQEL